MEEVLTKDISRVYYEGQYYERMYRGNKLIWPPDYLRHESINYTFNQKTGQFNVVQDAGFVEYLLDNTTIYLVKATESGIPVVIPVYSEPDYTTGGMNYVWGQKNPNAGNTGIFKYKIDPDVESIYISGSQIDIMTQIPTIYFSCREMEENMYDIKFSTYPFEGCHEVFGPDNLIGLYSGQEGTTGKWYSNVNVTGKHTFSQCRQLVANKGAGWRGAYSEEIGVLLMMGMFKTGVNGRILSTGYAPFGVQNPFVNGSGGRNYMPNIEIDPATNIAYVSHLDGTVEELAVPYIWGQSFSELYWGEYLTILPRKAGSGIYNTRNQCWMGNSKGISLYLSCNSDVWAISGDRDDTDVSGMEGQLRIRVCYRGEYTITNDIEYFESLPVL